MAVYFAPQRRDPDAELKQYMMMMAQLLGKRGQEAKTAEDAEALSQYGQYKGQLGEAESLRTSLMALTPEQRQSYQGPAPQWPAHQQFPQLQSPEMQQLAAKLQLGGLLQTPQQMTPYQQAQMGRPPSPTQQIAQKRLDRINQLQAKVQAGTATEAEKRELQRKIGPAPVVEFSGLDKLLTPGERVAKAKAPLRKALTPTEAKGVDVIIEQVVPQIKPPVDLPILKLIPGGMGPGPKYAQEDVGKMWEQVIEETGYYGRSEVAQRQIRAKFDRHIATLNKGKGIGVLAKQYEWSRKKWQGTKRRPGESINEFIERTGL